MESIHEWNEKIMALIEQLKKDHPELVGFLEEMPVTIPDEKDPRINISSLKDYFNSLMELENFKKPS